MAEAARAGTTKGSVKLTSQITYNEIISRGTPQTDTKKPSLFKDIFFFSLERNRTKSFEVEFDVIVGLVLAPNDFPSPKSYKAIVTFSVNEYRVFFLENNKTS
jgi:hypothetical protein